MAVIEDESLVLGCFETPWSGGFQRFSYRSKIQLGRERVGVSPPFVHASIACVSA